MLVNSKAKYQASIFFYPLNINLQPKKLKIVKTHSETKKWKGS